MTDKINQLVDQIRLATDYQINREILREKIQTDLHVTYNGGMFYVTTDLIAFLSTWAGDVIYLEDTFHNPIEINRSELLELCREQYQKVMNRWHQEHNELKRIRKI
jgi:hypothetical protein